MKPSEIAARRLKELRLQAGFTQEALARRLSELGFERSASSIAHLEHQRSSMALADLIAFALALEVTPLALVLDDLGEDETVEVAPDRAISADLYRRWWLGHWSSYRSWDLDPDTGEWSIFTLDNQPEEESEEKRRRSGREALLTTAQRTTYSRYPSIRYVEAGLRDLGEALAALEMSEPRAPYELSVDEQLQALEEELEVLKAEIARGQARRRRIETSEPRTGSEGSTVDGSH